MRTIFAKSTTILTDLWSGDEPCVDSNLITTCYSCTFLNSINRLFIIKNTSYYLSLHFISHSNSFWLTFIRSSYALSHLMPATEKPYQTGHLDLRGESNGLGESKVVPPNALAACLLVGHVPISIHIIDKNNLVLKERNLMTSFILPQPLRHFPLIWSPFYKTFSTFTTSTVQLDFQCYCSRKTIPRNNLIWLHISFPSFNGMGLLENLNELLLGNKSC